MAKLKRWMSSGAWYQTSEQLKVGFLILLSFFSQASAIMPEAMVITPALEDRGVFTHSLDLRETRHLKA